MAALLQVRKLTKKVNMIEININGSRLLCFVFIYLWLSILSIYAQDTNKVKDTSKVFDEAVFDKIVFREFANIHNPKATSSPGSFASIETKESEVKFNSTIQFTNGSILNLKFQGGVNDGIIAMINNSEFNTNVGLNIQYNIFLGSPAIRFYVITRDSFYIKLTKLRFANKQKNIEDTRRFDSVLTLLKIGRITKSVVDLNSKILEMQKNRTTLYDSLMVDSLITIVEKSKNEIEFLEIQNNSRINYVDIKNATLESEKKEIEQLENDIPIVGFDLKWLSFGYGLKNSVFRFFDPKSNYFDQISKKSYLEHTANIEFSYYRFRMSSFESFYFDLGSIFALKDNLDELSKSELNEKINYDSSNSERFTSKKFIAYSGDYYKDLKSLSFFTDYYRFLFEKNVAAVHLRLEHKIKEKTKPSLNVGLGILHFFKNEEKKDNVLNIELYAGINDVLNVKTPGEKIYKRIDFSLNIVLPINFKIKL